MNQLSTGRKKTILLIDDEPGLLDELSYFLEERGFSTVSREDGVSGLAALDEVRPDLVICDVSMPRMDGHEVLRRIRARGDDLKNVPFMFLTAHTMFDDELKARGIGADEFVGKPEDLQKILAKIESRLSQAERFERAARDRVRRAREQAERAAFRRERRLTGIIRQLVSGIDQVGRNVAALNVLLSPEADDMTADVLRQSMSSLESVADMVRMANIVVNMPGASRVDGLAEFDPREVMVRAVEGTDFEAARGLSVRFAGESRNMIGYPGDYSAITANLVLWTGSFFPGSEMLFSGGAVDAGAERTAEIAARISNPYHAAEAIVEKWSQAQRMTLDKSLESASLDPATSCALEVVDAAISADGEITARVRDREAVISVRWRLDPE